MRHTIVAGVLLVLFCSLPATPAQADSVPLRRPAPRGSPVPRATLPPAAAAALYSRRSRRLVQSYLRLKLLQMRATDLERARKVVERKLGITTLLGETPPPDAR
ncbi:MAG TPA: hypothetical protein VGD01_00290 [Candidatus Elarobacter sp.]